MTYALAPSGVTHIESGRLIGRGDPQWSDYLQWLSRGNVPALPTPPEVVAPPDVVPKSVSRFRARAVLQIAGLLESADAVVAEMHPLTQIAWTDAAYFRRDSPILISVAQQLGITDAQVDDFFRQAAALEL